MEAWLLRQFSPDRRADPTPKSSHPGSIHARTADPSDGSKPGGNVVAAPLELSQWLQTFGTPIVLRRGGETVFSEGTTSAFIYLIEDGLIRISRLTESGRRQILSFRWRGNLAGLAEEGRYVNSAETVSATKLLRISWPQLQERMLAEPKMQSLLFGSLTSQIREAQKRILILGQQSIPQRLASFLLDFLNVPGLYDAKEAKLKLPLSRFDLADYLGTSPESTARAFARLESENLIMREGTRTVVIRDLAGLQALQNERRRSQSPR